MTQEDKSILLKYLCMALPYGVMVNVESYDTEKLIGIENETITTKATPSSYSDKGEFPIDIVKPYLRTMSSMTEEEIDELKELCTMYEPSDSPNIGFEDYGIRVLTHHLSDDSISFSLNTKVIDWLLKNHFDFMGLIPMGLAIAVTKENNPY